MSTCEIKRQREVLLELCTKIHNNLQKYCTTIKIAGSLRRGLQRCGDIELVVVPKTKVESVLFGEPTAISELESFEFEKYYNIIKNGPRYKQFTTLTKDGFVKVDLFITLPPAQFGVNYFIRTGSEEFVKKYVTKKVHKGLLPNDMKVCDGSLYRIVPGKFDIKGEPEYVQVITPTEKDFFREIGQKFVNPNEREV